MRDSSMMWRAVERCIMTAISFYEMTKARRSHKRYMNVYTLDIAALLKLPHRLREALLCCVVHSWKACPAIGARKQR